jgi:hypothetical protein
MDPDSLIRVSELVHAIKVFIAAANRLKDEDMEHLDKIADLLERKGGNPKVNKAQFEKAEPIMQHIKHLSDLKKSINLPPECYSIEFKTASGSVAIAGNADLGSLSMNRLINEFKSIIDERIGKLEEEMEEI